MILNNLRFKILLLIFLFFNFSTYSYSKIMVLSGCDNIKDKFIKNEYILDLEKSLMTRIYIYDSKTYKKYRTTDLSVKRKNTVERFIYKEESLILTDKIGYPQFYTQLLFEMSSPIIKIKTVINNEQATSNLSKCKNIEIFDKES
jgi:hypothetical protein